MLYDNPLPSKQKIKKGIARLKKLIPKDSRVGFYPSSGPVLEVFNFDQLPLDYVICSDYEIKETKEGKIVTVQADNNLCLRYILEARIKLDAIFAVQDGAVEGGNYEWINSVGFLGRVLPALNKTFVLVNSPYNEGYINFDAGTVVKIDDDVPEYRNANYSAYFQDTTNYQIFRYKKVNKVGRTLNLNETFQIDEAGKVTKEVKSFLKLHYNTIWEDQTWLDGIFVRKRSLNNKDLKISLKKYWPSNYMPDKVFDITPLTIEETLLPLLEFANEKRMSKIGLVALTGKTQRLFPYFKHFEKNIHEILNWTKPYPSEIHLYFIDKNGFKFSNETVKNFPESFDLILKPVDETYLKLLMQFYESMYHTFRLEVNKRMLKRYYFRDLRNYYAKVANIEYRETSNYSDGILVRSSNVKDPFFKEYYIEKDGSGFPAKGVIPKALDETYAKAKYLEVSGKGYLLPPGCKTISKSGRYSVHLIRDSMTKKPLELVWDNYRRVMIPTYFYDLIGVDEVHSRVCYREFDGNEAFVEVDLENIDLKWLQHIPFNEGNNNDLNCLETRKKTYTIDIQTKYSSHLDFSYDWFGLYNPPDYFKIRKASMRKLLFEDDSQINWLEEMRKIKWHPYDNKWGKFYFSESSDHDSDFNYQVKYYGSYTNVIAELLVESDPNLLKIQPNFTEKGVFEPYSEFCFDLKRIRELVAKFEGLLKKYQNEDIDLDLDGMDERYYLQFQETF